MVVLVSGVAMSDDELEAKVREMVALDDVAFVSMLVYRPLAASWIAQREALRRVEELHIKCKDEGCGACDGCKREWPCPTVRALRGES